jgi:hypothetical protein
MPPEPIAVLRVLAPLLAPLPAATGDALAVWPGHPTHALTVCRPDLSVRSHRGCAEGELYGLILHLLLDGVLEPMSPASLAALARAS